MEQARQNKMKIILSGMFIAIATTQAIWADTVKVAAQ